MIFILGDLVRGVGNNMNFVADFFNYITSSEYYLKIDQAINQSFLYDSPLSSILFDLNRIAYNKPHFWIRTFLERLALVVDPSQSKFLWTTPFAFFGFVFIYKKLSKLLLKLMILFLISSSVKGERGWLIFLPCIVFFQVVFIVEGIKKYVIKK